MARIWRAVGFALVFLAGGFLAVLLLNSGGAVSDGFRDWVGALSGWAAALGAVLTVMAIRDQISDASRSAEQARRAVIAGQNQHVINQIVELHGLVQANLSRLAADSNTLRHQAWEELTSATLGAQLGQLISLQRGWSQLLTLVVLFKQSQWQRELLLPCIREGETLNQLQVDLIALLNQA